MKHTLTSLLFVLITFSLSAQEYSKQDKIRGSITPERAWWDLTHYDLKVSVNPDEKTIEGTNTITYTVLQKGKSMQIDLQPPMEIDKIEMNGKKVKFSSKGNAHYLKIKQKMKEGAEHKLTIHFSGKPREAVNAPWDGGFSWKKDDNGKHFVATSNQGLGASVWWPNKDHPYDEPENGVSLAITAPKDLVAVGNGRLVNTEKDRKTKTWHWEVTNPINNYGVNINIGDYVNFSEVYEGTNGDLDLDYWVLKDNLEKAKEQFTQAPMMIRAFEYWFGPYPFYEDSFKLVEVPYLGMEHQSSVTYGNKYQNGYLGNDLSGSGWGLRFDFIIIHEGGHEWFANNITNIDTADMWIQEGFTAYSESLYLNYHFSDAAASEYVVGTRRYIENKKPIIGTYNVNYDGDVDIYYKAANMLHTLRQLLEDDKKWRDILRGLNKDFYHQTVSSKQVEDYISEKSGIDLTEFFDQYLRTTLVPNLEYKVDGKKLEFRYTNVIEGFDMPVMVIINGNEEWIQPKEKWKSKKFSRAINEIEVKEDFYIDSQKIN